MEKKNYVMAREVAVEELNKWFDIMEVPEESRLDIDLDENEEDEENPKKSKESDDIMRERVIRGFMNGSIVLNTNNHIEYTLKEPIKKKDSEDVVLDKLIFRLRYQAFELETNMKGVKPDEFMAMTRAYIATLTKTGKAILGKLSNRDMDMAQAVYTLFTRGEA